MYSQIKKYMIGEALQNAKTVFAKTKLELVLSIIAIYIPLYIIGTIPVLIGKYWVIIVAQIIGFAFIVAMAITLKRTQSVKLPRKIWFYQGIFFTLSSALLNNGEASLLTFAFVFVNIVISFLMLGVLLRNIAIWYYCIFIVISLAITFDILPKITLPFDLTRESEFFNQSNINAILIALTMVAFIIDRFTRSHVRGGKQVIDQKVEIVKQKELIRKTNETARSSISLASQVQKDIVIDWTDIDTHFSSYYHFHLPKEILSGEFFWVQKKDDSVYFALIDTGEVGVPGAMFSFMIRNALSQILMQNTKSSPKTILEALNNFLNNSTLTTNGFNTNVKITLCKYSQVTGELTISGVAQPVIIEIQGKLKSFSPKNHSLNYLDNETEFDEVKIILAANDIIYLFTDGVISRKMKGERKSTDFLDFKTILYNSSAEVFENRNNLIAKTFLTKKEHELQTDDITIVGLKV
ncbi:MAG: PP2C family protein-serine/threonine phosphatase [Crocinitomicaceae bacterium]